MTIIIDNRSGQPIYDQIAEQLRRQILDGSLETGAALPSIRNLARDLRVSVITTKRAYEELEAEGLIDTVPGKGSFVAQAGPGLLREEHLRQIEEHLSAALTLARGAGLSLEDLRQMLDTLEEESL